MPAGKRWRFRMPRSVPAGTVIVMFPRIRLSAWAVVIVLVAACGDSASTTTADHGLADAEVATLRTLQEVDGYPLYTMNHLAPDPDVEYAAALQHSQVGGGEWACSLFAALGDGGARVVGRNFDWDFSPALLLFNDPPDGFASVSMVDITYLGFSGSLSADLEEKPLQDLQGLLDAPLIPFDGMNEAGLAVGMAAVPPGGVAADPGKGTVDSLGIIRIVLDHAGDVDEAISLFHQYNIDFEGQTPLHYLLADVSGDSALVEYYRGEIRVVRSETPWHQATNFLVSEPGPAAGRCDRYDVISAELGATGGDLSPGGAMELLSRVAQPHTQWSIVYGLDGGDIRVVMGRDYGRVHTFGLEMAR